MAIMKQWNVNRKTLLQVDSMRMYVKISIALIFIEDVWFLHNDHDEDELHAIMQVYNTAELVIRTLY